MNFALNYIKEFEDAAQAEAEKQQAERDRLTETIHRKIQDAIAVLFGDDAAAGDPKTEERNGYLTSVWLPVSIDGLATFYAVTELRGGKAYNDNGHTSAPHLEMHLTNTRPGDRSGYPHGRRSVVALPPAPSAPALPEEIRVKLGQFLKEQQQAHQAELELRQQKRAKAIEQKIGEIKRSFNLHYLNPSFPKPRAQAETLVAGLIELAPDRRDEFEALLTRWDDAHLAHLEQEKEKRLRAEENSRRKAEYEATKESYRVEFAGHWAAKQAAQNRNANRVDALQSRWDTPFSTYRLKFALVATEDGERYLETDTARCLYPPAGEYHRVISRGKITLMQFAHEVSRTAPEQVKPTDYTSGAFGIDISDYTGGWEQEIRYSPEADRNAVAADIAATFESVPAEPDEPETLAFADIKTIQGRVIKNDPAYSFDTNDYW